MARPPRQTSNNITGPISALSDFLRSHNISAQEIRETATARREAAALNRAQQAQSETASAAVDSTDPTELEDETGADAVTTTTTPAEIDNDNDDDGNVEDQVAVPKRRHRETAAELARRKKLEEKKAIDKIKTLKKRKRLGDDDDDDDIDDDDDDDPNRALARALRRQRIVPYPGQMTNCAICDKRFTVTPYTRNGPDGGLVCSTCGKDLDKDKPALKKKPRKSVGGVGRRRIIQSYILDGTFAMGAKPLAILCVEALAKNADLADTLEGLADRQIDRIARLFSKRRLLNPRTLPLFVRPSTERLHLYDAAYLTEADFIASLAVAHKLRHLKVKNGILFKDHVMDYLIDRNLMLETMYMHGANLLTDAAWGRFLQTRGGSLKSLRIYATDKYIGDHTIQLIQDHCPNLTRLKIYHNQVMTNDGVKALANLKGLTHLGLKLQNKTTSKAYVSVINSLGPTLTTLSLRVIPDATDEVLLAIRTHSRSLSKLQLTDSEYMTDEGFAHLFTDWENPPLREINLEKCRHIDSREPRNNPDSIGLCSNGFRALMQHSGSKLERLNIHACRHITAAAFEEAFAVDDEGVPTRTYPHLWDLEISFCEHVTPLIVRSIFKCCPRLRLLNVFGCMRVKDKGLKVPPTVNMVGGADAYGLRFDGA